VTAVIAVTARDRLIGKAKPFSRKLKAIKKKLVTW